MMIQQVRDSDRRKWNYKYIKQKIINLQFLKFNFWSNVQMSYLIRIVPSERTKPQNVNYLGSRSYRVQNSTSKMALFPLLRHWLHHVEKKFSDSCYVLHPARQYHNWTVAWIEMMKRFCSRKKHFAGMSNKHLKFVWPAGTDACCTAVKVAGNVVVASALIMDAESYLGWTRLSVFHLAW